MKTKYIFLIATIILGCWLAGSCSKKHSSNGVAKEPPPQVREQLRKQEEADAKRKASEEAYKKMQIAELVRKLEEDSGKDVEPFNSLAFREASTRGAGAARELAAAIRNSNRGSFLTLMAVRKLSKDDYNKIDEKSRIAILVDKFRNTKYFNAWGLPHLYWEEPAKALIEGGRNAVPLLMQLLRETREAPVWGSEEAGEYKKYKYRVCDYAMAMILEIQGKKGEIPVKPEDRDRIIQSLLSGGGRVPPVTGPTRVKP